MVSQIEAMNCVQEVSRQEHEVNNQREDDNAPQTQQPMKTNKTTATGTLPVDSDTFSKFVISVTLNRNFKLPLTLRPYDGTGNLQVHFTMFKSMVLLNGATDTFL